MKYATILFTTIVCAVSATAQNTLTVKCYTDNRFQNGIYLNDEVVDYAVCDTGFFVAVADNETCEFWPTNYENNHPDNDFGNFNNNNPVCRVRSERFFIFRYDQVSELNGMLNMLQQIPDGNPVVIYTPVVYDPASVAATSPALMTELESRWGVAALANPEIKVLFGRQGDAASYTAAARVPGADSVVFSTPVCQSLHVQEMPAVTAQMKPLSATTWQLSGVNNARDVEVWSMSGQRVTVSLNEDVITLPESVSSGSYLVSGHSDQGSWRCRLIVL